MAKKKAKTIKEIDIIKYGNRVLDAVNHGATDEQALFFLSTYQRYMGQLELIKKMEEELAKEETLLVEKEYVRGRETITTNPLLRTYNATCTAANSTVKTLISIIKQLDTATIGTSTDDEFEEFLKS